MENTLVFVISLFLCSNISFAIFVNNDLIKHIAAQKHEIPGLSLNNVDEYRRKWAYSDTGVSKQDLEHWTGRYFPDQSTERPTNNPGKTERQKMMFAAINKDCDDGKTNLTVDWYDSPVNYTCYMREFLSIDPKLPSVLHSELIPPLYEAEHACMSSHIDYDTIIPTFGTHRPAWPKYGEYKFVPKQRWLHNLEHGSVVMLYHPCAHPILVNHLRHIVVNCLYRHIITPYNLPIDRPFALVTWGHYYAFNDPITNEKGAVEFILNHAKHAPEQMSRDGIYDHALIKHADIVKGSDINDTVLCPSRSTHRIKSHKLTEADMPRDRR
ncbi:hypothetical protein M8J76_011503 [Diaphorina citri]|jgi:Protein of unknown function (DUF3105).|nr:hypothetical protein M8J75_012073 [Diaphorina citri]KAI5737247.1 hypothetical protein M8J76_011503 [Diaphorina citri]